MNVAPRPGDLAGDRSTPDAPVPAGVTAALVTPSYAGDFERCRLLCETVDRHVSGATMHYILVEGRDVPLFRSLASARREIVDERDILPGWLRPFGDPTTAFRRRIWLSLKTKPLRGWHVQQMRRIALAAHVPESVLVYCDSDVAFVRPFDCGQLWKQGRLRLLRRDDALATSSSAEHVEWSRNAATLLGLRAALSPHDYIGTLIGWRRDTVRAMAARIEKVTGRSWPESLGRVRRFSECMIYGRFVDEVADGAGHVADPTEFCRVYWQGRAGDAAAFDAFLTGIEPHQVAIGIQSFIGVEIHEIRRKIAELR